MWEISDENKQKADLTELKFILEQSEKQLKHSVDNSITIVTRTTILLTVMVGLLSSLLIYCANAFDEINYNDPKPYVAAVIISYLLYYITTASFNIKGFNYNVLGSEPDRLLHDYYYNEYPNPKERKKAIYIAEVESYQERILNNKAINKKRWAIFNRTILALVYLPPIVVAAYVIVTLIIVATHSL